MKPESVIDQQRENTLKAYNGAGLDYSESELDGIADRGMNNKSALLSGDTFIIEKPWNHEAYTGEFFYFRELESNNPEYKFNFQAANVTERSSGKCLPLKKWLFERFDGETTKQYLDKLNQKHTYIITKNPWFLIGSSVSYNGRQLESSCHAPQSSHDEYKSGAISYALDSQTIVFVKWCSDKKGIIGRQLVHIDNHGIVTGRIYGFMSEGDSTFLRSELYQILHWNKNEMKKTNNFRVNVNGFQGYQDSTYYTAYRNNRDEPVTINLVEPRCCSCGSKHTEQSIYCSDCSPSNKIICCSCGSRLDEDEAYYDDYSCYCGDCFHEHYFYCDHCEDYFSHDDRCDTDDNHHFCPRCAEREGYWRCYDCGTYTSEGNVVSNGELLCQDCTDSQGYQYCEQCGEWQDDCSETKEGNLMCESCLTDQAYYCKHCKTWNESGECEECKAEESADNYKEDEGGNAYGQYNQAA